MKLDILIAGIGGQGAVLLGNFIRSLFFHKFPESIISGTESRGVSQREGSVTSQIRIRIDETKNNQNSQASISLSPEIPEHEADIIIAMEPLEFVRNMKYVSNNTLVVCNAAEIPPKNLLINQLNGDPSGLKTIADVFQKLRDLYKTIKWVDTLDSSYYDEKSIREYISKAFCNVNGDSEPIKPINFEAHGSEIPLLSDRFGDVKFYYGNFTEKLMKTLETAGLLNMVMWGFISCYFSKILTLDDHQEFIEFYFSGNTDDSNKLIEINKRAFNLGVNLMCSLSKTQNSE